MSIYGAMFSGVSGLAAQSQALGMISDNISNVNTIGYKETAAHFQTLVTEAASTTRYAPGGVQSRPFQKIDKQGLLQGSSSPTDLAIAGSGFFVVNEDAVPGPGDNYLYTRAGNFTTDDSGNLTTNGYYLQGWPLTSAGALPTNTTVLSSLETVNFSGLTGAAKATTSIELALNLPAQDAVNATHTLTMQIYDSLGAAHDLPITFTKTGTNAWSFAAGTVTGGTSAGAGTISFNGDGTPNTITIGTPFAVTGWSTGASNTALTLDLGTSGSGDGVTQSAGDFVTSVIDQDGLKFGNFTGVKVDEDGIVTALFDNGQQRDIYQLPIATFRNPNGLEAQNGNAFLMTNRSGDVLLNQANSGNAGKVAPSSLESSTVDLAEEFTNMIITQRAYSASAKVITTADQMLDELINIRR